MVACNWGGQFPFPFVNSALVFFFWQLSFVIFFPSSYCFSSNSSTSSFFIIDFLEPILSCEIKPINHRAFHAAPIEDRCHIGPSCRKRLRRDIVFQLPDLFSSQELLMASHDVLFKQKDVLSRRLIQFEGASSPDLKLLLSSVFTCLLGSKCQDCFTLLQGSKEGHYILTTWPSRDWYNPLWFAMITLNDRVKILVT